MRAEKTKQMCDHIMMSIIKAGYTCQVSEKDLVQAIRESRMCLDERTVNRWINGLIAFGYLNNEKPQVYSVNVAKVPELTALIQKHKQAKL